MNVAEERKQAHYLSLTIPVLALVSWAMIRYANNTTASVLGWICAVLTIGEVVCILGMHYRLNELERNHAQKETINGTS